MRLIQLKHRVDYNPFALVRALESLLAQRRGYLSIIDSGKPNNLTTVPGVDAYSMYYGMVHQLENLLQQMEKELSDHSETTVEVNFVPDNIDF